MNGALNSDLLCIDSLQVFKEVQSFHDEIANAQLPRELRNCTPTSKSQNSPCLGKKTTVRRQLFSEHTTSQDSKKPKVTSVQAEQRCYTDQKRPECSVQDPLSSVPSDKYKGKFGPPSFALGKVYKILFGCEMQSAHSAEADCIALVQIFNKRFDTIVPWIDQNAQPL